MELEAARNNTEVDKIHFVKVCEIINGLNADMNNQNKTIACLRKKRRCKRLPGTLVSFRSGNESEIMHSW
jgi:hypothetical protein